MQNKVYITNPEEPSNEVGIAIIKKTGTENFDKYIDVVYNEYDGFNRLVEYENINGGSKTKVSFTYNGDDLRVSKTTAEGTTTYTYSGQYVIEDTQNTYIMGMGYIGMTTGEYYMFNGHGDVVQTVDGTGVKNSYTYDEFGNLTSELNETDTNSILYAGEFYDRETGLYYLRARYYDPSVGRFISEDSARDGNNWYVYAYNNPIKYKDPTGKWGELVHVTATRWMIEQAGLNVDVGTLAYHIEIIVAANIGVDSGDTAATNQNAAAQGWHFGMVKADTELFKNQKA